MSICVRCDGRGWIADGSSHGVACSDCAPPVVRRFIEAPPVRQKPAPKREGRKPVPTPAFGGPDVARVASGASDIERRADAAQCRVAGCDQRIVDRMWRLGLCSMHYQRQHRNGDLEKRKPGRKLNLTPEVVPQMKRMRAAFKTYAEIARAFDCSDATVRSILHGTYKWPHAS